MHKYTRVVLATLLLGLSVLTPVRGYRILYREQLYELYHQHQLQYPIRINENIVLLEQVLKADFANPLNALAVIETTEEWRRYRALFNMHIYLQLTKQYLQLASQYFKFNAYFYNWPWQQQNLASLGIAREYIEDARYYWAEARRWSSAAWEQSTLFLEEIQYWADENWRIEMGRLNYNQIIDRHIERLTEIENQFKAMDSTTY